MRSTEVILNKEQKIRTRLIANAISDEKQDRTEKEKFNEKCYVRFFLANVLEKARRVYAKAREEDLRLFLDELFIDSNYE